MSLKESISKAMADAPKDWYVVTLTDSVTLNGIEYYFEGRVYKNRPDDIIWTIAGWDEYQDEGENSHEGQHQIMALKEDDEKAYLLTEPEWPHCYDCGIDDASYWRMWDEIRQDSMKVYGVTEWQPELTF